MTQVRLLDQDGPDLQALEPHWDALAREHGRRYAARPSYALSWWRELGRSLPATRLAVLAVHRQGELVAVAPLHRRRLLGRPVLRWLGHGLGTVGELVARDEGAATAAWAALARLGAPLQLVHVRLHDPGTRALLASPHWQASTATDDRCPIVELPPGTGARALRGSRSLRRLSAYRRALEEAHGPFTLELVDDEAGLDRRWPDIQRVAAAADAGRDRTDLCAPPYDGFTRRFLAQEARAGGLLLVGATAGGRWIAHEVGLRSGPRLDLWLSRFDPELSRMAPGHLIARELVERHDQLGVAVLDLGLGENAYKRAWQTGGYAVGRVLAAPRLLPLATARLALATTLGDAARATRARVQGVRR